MSALWEGVREGCGTCRFATSAAYGRVECKRRPPKIMVVRYWDSLNERHWDAVEQHRPSMEQSDWCGEYERTAS
jgi:hypothetical protein